MNCAKCDDTGYNSIYEKEGNSTFIRVEACDCKAGEAFARECKLERKGTEMECEECGSSDVDVNETARTDWKCQECGAEFNHEEN